MSRDLILRLLAFATVAVFVGILVLEVPRFDLGAVVAVTVLLLLWDFFFHRES